MILAILQARMGSTRLPGKVLKPILGEPMLFRQIERLRRCRSLGALIVATSTEPSDDQLVAACQERNISVARGSVSDVLDRFVIAMGASRPDAIVRLTGDCPLADPDVIDAVVRFFGEGDLDYASNVDPPTFPDGLDVEVMKTAALLRAHREAKLLSEREHVTPYLRNHPELFKLGCYRGATDLSGLRWTVDEPADFDFVSLVYERLYPMRPDFRLPDILALLRAEPAIATINSNFERNEGLKKSLAMDHVGQNSSAGKLTK
jgi:spore coat polysaccharide biosynthesis protein SpsF (cytidylyltransferase family)